MAAQLVTLLGVRWLSQRLGLLGLSSRFARGWLAAATLAASGLLMVALARSHGTWLPALLAIGAFSIGSAIYALGPVLVAEVTPPARRGAMLGIVNAIATLAGPLAPATMGLLIDAGASAEAGYRHGVTMAGIIIIVAALTGLLLINPERSARHLGHHRA